MPERETDRRRRERERAQASLSPARGDSHPILALQRSAGNRAVAQMLARKAIMMGNTVQIHGVGQIKVKGGNLEEWAGSEVPNTVEVTSEKGKHSAKLEKLANEHTTTDVKVTIASTQQSHDELSVGGGTELEIKGARVKGYAIADGAETWRLADFTNVHRTKISHRAA